MSVSAKLADYEASWELLSRLSFDELLKLGRQNGITFEKKDAQGNVQKVRSKEEAIDVLVTSEFKESDLIELLGINRLTKEELLHIMSANQLKRLAKETGVLLEKPTLFGMKKAEKKKDIIRALRVLSVQKVREYAEKTGLIKKATRKTRKRKPAKVTAKKPSAKTAKRKRTRKAEKAKPLVKKRDQPTITPAHVEEKKVEPIVIPPQQAQLETPRILEETMKEVRIERQIIRRRLVPKHHKKVDKQRRKQH
ncbi:hypothetical protein KEJ18_00765 [Candidatus Bathyarchaeota archaeon]|nr:hypothetical protein [Candidatus Bathyarchaeota archaeon]